MYLIVIMNLICFFFIFYIVDWREGFFIVYIDNGILDNSEVRSLYFLIESVVDDLYICFQQNVWGNCYK